MCIGIEVGSGRRFLGGDDVRALYNGSRLQGASAKVGAFLAQRRRQLILVEEMIQGFHGETPCARA